MPTDEPVTVRALRREDLGDDLLAGFDRKQSTTRVLRFVDAWLVEIEDRFEEDWDAVQRAGVVIALRACLRDGGRVFGAHTGGHLVGFASVEGERFGPGGRYVEMPYLHVTRPRRGAGVGALLFRRSLTAARDLGAGALYIAAHPSVETQAFYGRMRCGIARDTHRTILEREPLDIQLERVVDALE